MVAFGDMLVSMMVEEGVVGGATQPGGRRKALGSTGPSPWMLPEEPGRSESSMTLLLATGRILRGWEELCQKNGRNARCVLWLNSVCAIGIYALH